MYLMIESKLTSSRATKNSNHPSIKRKKPTQPGALFNHAGCELNLVVSTSPAKHAERPQNRQ
jgi:hypothetical protein